MNILGRNIRRARQAKGLTQTQAAIDLECSLNTYTKIERGETNVPFLRLVQIAEYLNVAVADLVRDDIIPDTRSLEEEILGMRQDIAIIKDRLLEKEQ